MCACLWQYLHICLYCIEICWILQRRLQKMLVASTHSNHCRFASWQMQQWYNCKMPPPAPAPSHHLRDGTWNLRPDVAQFLGHLRSVVNLIHHCVGTWPTFGKTSRTNITAGMVLFARRERSGDKIGGYIPTRMGRWNHRHGEFFVYSLLRVPRGHGNAQGKLLTSTGNVRRGTELWTNDDLLNDHVDPCGQCACISKKTWDTAIIALLYDFLYSILQLLFWIFGLVFNHTHIMHVHIKENQCIKPPFFQDAPRLPCPAFTTTLACEASLQWTQTFHPMTPQSQQSRPLPWRNSSQRWGITRNNALWQASKKTCNFTTSGMKLPNNHENKLSRYRLGMFFAYKLYSFVW